MFRHLPKRQGPCLGDSGRCGSTSSSILASSVSSSDSSTTPLTNTATSTTTSTATPSSSSSTPSSSSPTPGSFFTTSSVSSSQPSATSTTSSSMSSPSSSTVALTTSTHVNAGSIAGAVVGGAVFLALVLLGILLYLRNRKRKRTPPSSEFMNSLKPGDPPVLRLDSGDEYPPAFPEKANFAHYPTALQHHTYDVKIPEEMMSMTDIPSPLPSIGNVSPRPRRFSLQPLPQSVPKRHRPTGSVGSWMHVVSRESSSSSPPRDSVLLFAPRFSSQESFTHSEPISLQPLRRQPD